MLIVSNYIKDKSQMFVGLVGFLSSVKGVLEICDPAVCVVWVCGQPYCIRQRGFFHFA